MWITLTDADLQTKLAAGEYASITTAQLPEGVTAASVIAAEIASTTGMVRGYVAGQLSNTLGAGVTIPGELKDTALVIVRHKIFSRLPGLKRLLDEPRVREYEDALATLRDVAAGRFRIVPPEEPAADQPAGQTIKVVRHTQRQSSRKNWSGTL